MKILKDNVLRIECPACQQPMEMDIDAARKGVICPECSEFFVTALPAQAGAAYAHTQKRVAAIRNTASNFRAFAMICGLIGMFVMGATLVSLINGESHPSGWILSSAMIGAALWLYLIAQIIHIRANTLK